MITKRRIQQLEKELNLVYDGRFFGYYGHIHPIEKCFICKRLYCKCDLHKIRVNGKTENYYCDICGRLNKLDKAIKVEGGIVYYEKKNGELKVPKS